MPFKLNGTQFYSVADVAKRVGVTRQTLYRWIGEGKVKGPGYERQRDGRRFYSKSELDVIYAFANQVERVDTTPHQMRFFNSASVEDES